MTKKFKPMKVKDSSIRLPDEFLDHFLINEGDYIALIEENGKFYLRKTRDLPSDEPDVSESTQSGEPEIPPKTFDEIMREAQKFANGDMFSDEVMKSLQDTLKDPEMMKKIQDMAMGMFKGFNPASSTPSDSNQDSEKKEKKKSKKDDEDDDEGFKINID